MVGPSYSINADSDMNLNIANSRLLLEEAIEATSIRSSAYKDFDNDPASLAEKFVADIRDEKGPQPALTCEDHISSPVSVCEEYVSKKSLLYCRLCNNDPCVDVTATFCGHVFCNK